jgi:Ferredoxin thioredoxin reductase variable alpha chain
MKIGDRIRVKESVMVYHHPSSKQKPFDIQGMEGEIISIIDKPVTATCPIKVQFDQKFSAHLREDEVEIIA